MQGSAKRLAANGPDRCAGMFPLKIVRAMASYDRDLFFLVEVASWLSRAIAKLAVFDRSRAKPATCTPSSASSREQNITRANSSTCSS